MKRGQKWKIAMLGLMLVAGCVKTGGSSCAGWEAIRLSEESIAGLTPADAKEILDHNEFGKEIGCW